MQDVLPPTLPHHRHQAAERDSRKSAHRYPQPQYRPRPVQRHPVRVQRQRRIEVHERRPSHRRPHRAEPRYPQIPVPQNPPQQREPSPAVVPVPLIRLPLAPFDLRRVIPVAPKDRPRQAQRRQRRPEPVQRPPPVVARPAKQQRSERQPAPDHYSEKRVVRARHHHELARREQSVHQQNTRRLPRQRRDPETQPPGYQNREIRRPPLYEQQPRTQRQRRRSQYLRTIPRHPPANRQRQKQIPQERRRPVETLLARIQIQVNADGRQQYPHRDNHHYPGHARKQPQPHHSPPMPKLQHRAHPSLIHSAPFIHNRPAPVKNQSPKFPIPNP